MTLAQIHDLAERLDYLSGVFSTTFKAPIRLRAEYASAAIPDRAARIVACVAGTLGVSLQAITSRAKDLATREARQVAVAMLRKYQPDMTYWQIAAHVGGILESSVCYALRRVDDLLAVGDAQMRAKIERCEAAIKQL